MLSPHQIRQAGALAFRNRQAGAVVRSLRPRRAASPRAPAAGLRQPLAVSAAPAAPRALPLRAPWPGETPLSPLEILQGVRDGVIDAGML